jgi:hypothetical protein
VPGFRSDTRSFLLFNSFKKETTYDALDLSELIQEVSGLQALEYQMTRNLDELTLQRDMAKLSTTFRGRVYNLAGRLFAVYCVFRVVSVSPSLIGLHSILL